MLLLILIQKEAFQFSSKRKRLPGLFVWTQQSVSAGKQSEEHPVQTGATSSSMQENSRNDVSKFKSCLKKLRKATTRRRDTDVDVGAHQSKRPGRVTLKD